MNAKERNRTIMERAKALRVFAGGNIPKATPELMKQANAIADGTVFFYNVQPVKIGLSDIDWSGGHIKHQEWNAQLHRFGYLIPLASAFAKTGDERYARAARSYIEDWVKQRGGFGKEYALRPGDRTLDMSIRLGTSMNAGWGGTLPTFMASETFDEEFVEEVLGSISRQAGDLSKHLPGWGNWRISVVDALVLTAIRFPFFENAGEVLEIGIKKMRNALATQFLPDGVHLERTPGYHDWMTRVALNYFRLAKLFPEANARVNPEGLPKSYDYMVQSVLCGINDAVLPLADKDLSAQLAERREALKVIAPRKAVKLPPMVQVFPNAGQAFVRTGFKPGSEYLGFDASSWGGVHLHLGRLGFTYRAGGRPLIVDPGYLTYEASNRFGPYGKSTPAHSTLNVDGLNQTDCDARLLRTEFTPRTALIWAEYDGGYWEGTHVWGFKEGHGRGTSGIHRRLLFWVRGEYMLALDALETDAGKSIHNVWQMGPADSWKRDPKTLSAWTTGKHKNVLVKLVMSPPEVEMDAWEGSEKPLRGWVQNYGHDPVPAPQVEFRYPASGYYEHPTDSAVLIAAFDGMKKPDYRVAEVIGPTEKHYHTMRLRLPDGREDVFYWSRNMEVPADTGKPVSSDACFTWLRFDVKGRAREGFVLDGSYLEYEGKTLFENRKRETKLMRFASRR